MPRTLRRCSQHFRVNIGDVGPIFDVIGPNIADGLGDPLPMLADRCSGTLGPTAL